MAIEGFAFGDSTETTTEITTETTTEITSENTRSMESVPSNDGTSDLDFLIHTDPDTDPEQKTQQSKTNQRQEPEKEHKKDQTKNVSPASLPKKPSKSPAKGRANTLKDPVAAAIESEFLQKAPEDYLNIAKERGAIKNLCRYIDAQDWQAACSSKENYARYLVRAFVRYVETDPWMQETNAERTPSMLSSTKIFNAVKQTLAKEVERARWKAMCKQLEIARANRTDWLGQVRRERGIIPQPLESRA